jgi:hypothetical protein
VMAAREHHITRGELTEPIDRLLSLLPMQSNPPPLLRILPTWT